nr:glycosyl hydrolase 115 family protein [Lachnospiraceae bacterium]
EKGIRDIWIVNVGDLKPQELPLSYFMDLAYDYDRWGEKNPDSPGTYLKKWIKDTFGQNLPEDMRDAIFYLLDGYTYLNSIRKPESQYPDTYHYADYGEADAILSYCEDLKKMAECVRNWFESSGEEACFENPGSGKKRLLDCYDELVWFPVLATVNQHEMMISAGKNDALSRQGRFSANRYADRIDECVKKEKELKDHYHKLNGGKWSGIMSSEHVGFEFWNEEENRYPVRKYVYRANKERIIVSLPYSDVYTMGGDWTRKSLCITDFLMPDRDSSFFVMENSGDREIRWEAEADAGWIEISDGRQTCAKISGLLGKPCYSSDNSVGADLRDAVNNPVCEDQGDNSVLKIDVCINRKKLTEAYAAKETCGEKYLKDREALCGSITVRTPLRKIIIKVFAYPFTEEELKTDHVIPVIGEGINGLLHPSYDPGVLPGLMRKDPAGDDIGLCMEISEYDHTEDTDKGSFRLFEDYGKYGKGLKAYPTVAYTPGKDAPCAVFNVHALKSGSYDLTVITACSNPIDGRNELSFGLRVNGGEIRCVDLISKEFRGGDRANKAWSEGIMRAAHEAAVETALNEGSNEIRIYAKDPGIVFERLLLREAGTEWAPGFLGVLPERFR